MKKYQNIFKTLGFEIESLGGREYSIRAVPQNLFGMTEQGFFIEVLDHLEEGSILKNAGCPFGSDGDHGV